MSTIIKDLDSFRLLACSLPNPKDRLQLALTCSAVYEKIKFTFLFKQIVHKCDGERKLIEEEMYRTIGKRFSQLNLDDEVDAYDWLGQIAPLDKQIQMANFWNTFNNDTFKKTKNHGLLIQNFDEAQNKFHEFNKLNDLLQKFDTKDASLALRKASAEILQKEIITNEQYRLLCKRSESAINKSCTEGNTPLILAIRRGHLQFVHVLAEFRIVDPSIKNKKGVTAVHYAASQKITNYLEILLNKLNANVNIQDNEGKTPLQWALQHNNKECIDYLIKKGAIN